jgi:hypothetical protein
MGNITPKIVFIGDGIFANEKDIKDIINQIRRHTIPGHGEMIETFSKIQRFIVGNKDAIKLIVWDVSHIDVNEIPKVLKRQMESEWSKLTVVLTAKPHLVGRVKSLFPPENQTVLAYSEITIDKIKELLGPPKDINN